MRPKEGAWLVGGIVATVVAVVVAVVVVVVGRRSEPRRILVVGDSVTFLSASEIEHRFAGDHVEIIARPGYRSLDLRPLLADRLAHGPEPQVGVFLVGYNDVRRETVDSRALAPMVEASATLDCSVWLTLPSLPGGEPAGNPRWDPQRFDEWNERLHEQIDGLDNVHLVDDWRALVTDGDPAELLDVDHVHPIDAGSRRLADAMARAVERDC